jgi:hypothetical protein
MRTKEYTDDIKILNKQWRDNQKQKEKHNLVEVAQEKTDGTVDITKNIERLQRIVSNEIIRLETKSGYEGLSFQEIKSLSELIECQSKIQRQINELKHSDELESLSEEQLIELVRSISIKGGNK